ncbi:hypothetical protein BD770DRAFT_453024 [Pilaira anomala]|nr:hypothetical protein BD770DRAFT_453024 [Pilaira anomala]
MNFIISIDLGSTFSGSCYTEHPSEVINICNWEYFEETYEKNPTACLYTKQSPPKFIAWGFGALDYARTHPEDPTVLLVRHFKHHLFTNAISRVAAVDYLRELYKHTCTRIIANNPNIANPKFSCVLTVPDVWTEAEKTIYRNIAAYAGIPCYPKEILLIVTEAEANALYCERYVLENINEGDSFMICDIGGFSTSISVYEATIPSKHCQLYQETLFKCGSIVLEQNMNLYLRTFSYLSLSSKIRGALTDFVIRKKPIFSETDGEPNAEDQIKLLLSHSFDQFLQSGDIELIHQAHQEVEKSSQQGYNQNSIELRFKCIDIARQVYDPFINNIIGRLEAAIIQSPDLTRTIFLSGGCSELTYIFRRIHDHFTSIPTYASQGIQVIRKQGERATMMGGILAYLDFFKKVEKITNYIKIHGELKSTHTLVRQAARSYGVQIVTYPLVVSTNDFEMESVVSKESLKASYKDIHFVPVQDIKNFHELISQNTVLPILPTLGPNFITWQYHVDAPCYVAINLYAYVYDVEGNNSISCENIIRLHRFRVPVYNAKDTIELRYRAELYSLLFSAFHDRYVSDYRCTDLMYTLY